jgi:hypothetical protein
MAQRFDFSRGNRVVNVNPQLSQFDLYNQLSLVSHQRYTQAAASKAG